MDNIHTDYVVPLTAALRLIANIREAAGDPEGKLTPNELVSRIRRMNVTLSALIHQTEDPPTVTMQQVGELAAKALQ